MKAIVDCNNFYCSCERLFRPHLNQKPVVVLSNNDGCIVSRSDEAKKLGIEMAIAYFMAKPLIKKHNVTVFSSNYNLYGDLSMRVMDTLRYLVGEQQVEVYSVDEAFLKLDRIPDNTMHQVCRQIKENPATKHVPVIMLTAKKSRDDMARGEQVGADWYITKPFKSAMVIETIQRFLAQA